MPLALFALSGELKRAARPTDVSIEGFQVVSVRV